MSNMNLDPSAAGPVVGPSVAGMVEASVMDQPVGRRPILGIALASVVGYLTSCARGETTPDAAPTAGPSTPAPTTSQTAEALPPITAPDLSRLQSHNGVVHGVAAMEQRAGRGIFAGVMEFFNLPASGQGRNEAMDWQPAALRQVAEARFDRPPVVILEPDDPSLANMRNLEAAIDAYAAAMKANGVTAAQLGTVVLSPEAIVGRLSGSNPGAFVQGVDIQRAALERHFPGVETTILIDTAPQERPALVAALRRQPLAAPLRSVGIQAYGNGARIPFDADGKPDISRYLTADAVEEIARAAGTNTVWLNTGIIREDTNSYALGTYTLEERVAMAHAVADVVAELQRRGITVEQLTLFAENKLQKPAERPEGRDFSFHPGDEPVLTQLHDRLRALNVPMVGFDTR